MDAGRFYDTGRALLDSLGERLSPHDQDLAGGWLESGEWGLFIDEVAAAVSQDRVPIEATERDLLREVLYTFDQEDRFAEDHPMIWKRDEVMASLNVVGGAPRGRVG